jgi:hypothetical protein
MSTRRIRTATPPEDWVRKVGDPESGPVSTKKLGKGSLVAQLVKHHSPIKMQPGAPSARLV